MNTTNKVRKKIVNQAIANEKLEGLTVSKKSISIADKYITGELSAEEAAKKIKARYGNL